MIFVFGSNLGGRHGKGAALTALRQHGAEYGIGEGPTGQAYALPTCGYRFEPLLLDRIQEAVGRFITFAADVPNDFQVTRVGCGLGGYVDEDIAPMFREAPNNCLFDLQWRRILGSGGYRYWGTF